MGNGKDFELLTKKIFEKLSENTQYTAVEHDVKLEGKDGPRQIDVLISAEVAGMEIKTIVECKDFKSKISVSKVDALHSVMLDVNANKAVLVSRSGFSSTAIKKAKRLGISLYTAHEALKDDWEIDIELPIVVKEIVPIKINPSFLMFIQQGVSFNKNDVHVVNDISVFEAFKNQWMTNPNSDQKYEDGKFYEFTIDEIKAPYFIRDTHGRKCEIKDFIVGVTVKVNYFKGYLNEQENTQVLKDILEESVRCFFELSNVFNYREKFKKVELADRPMSGAITVECIAKPHVEFMGSAIAIEKVR